MFFGFISSFKRWHLVAPAALAMALAFPANAAYEPPDFDAPPFDTDALLLEENDRDEIVNALAALATNFPDDAQVDDDLREKAIAIATAINPLDGAARAAHKALSRKRKPTPVDYFTSLPSITRALWRHAEKLVAIDAEPENRKLAPFLMEISLVLNSGPTDDEIWLFGHATGFRPPRWHSFVSLQMNENESNRHAQDLVKAATELRELASAQPGTPGTPGTTSPPPGPGNGMTPKGKSKGTGKQPSPANERAEIKTAETTIRYAAFVPDVGAIPGELRLEARKPTDDEKSLYGLFLGANSADRNTFPMRLVWDRDGPTIAGYEAAESLVKQTYPRWPRNLIGEFSFKAVGPNQPSQVNGTLPCAILLESVFSGATVPPDLAIAGSLSEEGAIGLPGPAADLARAAGAGDGAVVKVLLMPEEAAAGLTDAVTAGDLTVLVRPQIVAYGSFEEATSLALDDRPEELTKALQMFDETQNLTAQGMTLDEIAKNAAVQNRLRSIVELWPGHLSAKIMLAYGDQPAGMKLSPAGTLGQIDQAVKPVAKYYTDSVFGGTVVGDAEKLVEKARTTLRELRTNAHPDARDCLNASEQTIEAFDEYFSLTNKSSARAAQLRRALQEAVNDLNTARNQLGATDTISL